jgi:LonB-like, AAA domain
MAEERPQPLQPFSEVQNEVRRLFQELIHQPWGARSASAATGWQPCCDMAETAEAIIVEVELPGVERHNVHIAVDGDVLLNLEDALTEPFVWKPLKRTLQSNQITIEAYRSFCLLYHLGTTHRQRQCLRHCRAT